MAPRPTLTSQQIANRIEVANVARVTDFSPDLAHRLPGKPNPVFVPAAHTYRFLNDCTDNTATAVPFRDLWCAFRGWMLAQPAEIAARMVTGNDEAAFQRHLVRWLEAHCKTYSMRPDGRLDIVDGVSLRSTQLTPVDARNRRDSVKLMAFTIYDFTPELLAALKELALGPAATALRDGIVAEAERANHRAARPAAEDLAQSLVAVIGNVAAGAPAEEAVHDARTRRDRARDRGR